VVNDRRGLVAQRLMRPFPVVKVEVDYLYATLIHEAFHVSGGGGTLHDDLERAMRTYNTDETPLPGVESSITGYVARYCKTSS
jgi:antirestriction protein ArdC